MKLAEAKGAEVVRVFEDNDLSASGKVYRPGYQQMLQMVRDGQLDLLIAHKAARFTRDGRESLDMIDLAGEHQFLIATTVGDYDLTTARGRKRWRDDTSDATYEREEVAELVRLKHAELRQNGKFHGGQRGFGYVHTPVLVGSRLRYRVELHEQEAAHVKAAARRVLSGGSLSAITREWNTGGILRPRGRLWTTDRVRELLTGPRIAGLRQNGAELVEADWPAIVTRDEWEQLRAILGPSPKQRGPKEPRSYLGSGIFVCDLCGTPLIGQARMGTPAYACRRERGGCGRLHRTAKPLDDYLADAVLTALSSQEFRAKLEIRYGSADDEAMALVAERDGALARLKQLRDALADGTIDADDFAHAKRRIEPVIDGATVKLSELQRTNALADLPQTRGLLEMAWDRADLDQRRGLVRLCISAVTIKAPGGGVRFKPEQADPLWTV
jgi:DNA invertase Pin-like site-specific DNA recombinase